VLKMEYRGLASATGASTRNFSAEKYPCPYIPFPARTVDSKIPNLQPSDSLDESLTSLSSGPIDTIGFKTWTKEDLVTFL